jgi:hypothetical protein
VHATKSARSTHAAKSATHASESSVHAAPTMHAAKSSMPATKSTMPTTKSTMPAAATAKPGSRWERGTCRDEKHRSQRDDQFAHHDMSSICGLPDRFFLVEAPSPRFHAFDCLSRSQLFFARSRHPSGGRRHSEADSSAHHLVIKWEIEN